MILFALFLMVIGIIIWAIGEYGRKQLALENEYDRLYGSIQRDIDFYEVTAHNYDIVEFKIKRLNELRWKNKEKTYVLTNQFLRKFAKERMTRAINRKTA